MDPTSPSPDAATIDAWLEGKLSQDQTAAVERYFDANPTARSDSAGPIAGVELTSIPTAGKQDPALDQLIDRVITQYSAQSPPPGADDWRGILDPCEDPQLLGTLGDYQVMEVIATGGMGIVFKARDPELNRIAAIKALSPQLASNAIARERFLREARAAAQLEHENILPIYGVHDGPLPYFAMRYAGGGTLQQALETELTFDDQKNIARQIAAALQAAHSKGIIHRDIKPANILFDTAEQEHVWVCDFGIARSTEDPSLTYGGGVAGTPQYMSPEQADGEPLDGRSDLFSLGVVLYRCATGSDAFAGETTAAVLNKLATNEPTSVTNIDASLPRWYGQLLTKLLAKKPADRPQDAAAVIDAIDHPTDSRRNATIATLIGVAALALVALTIAVNQRRPGPPANAAGPAPDTIPLTSFEDRQPGLIDLTMDPRFGTSAVIVSEGPGITDGKHAARSILAIDRSIPAIDPTYQNLARLDINELKAGFEGYRQLLVDVHFEGDSAADIDLCLTYFDNRSAKLYEGERTSLQNGADSQSTFAFALDTPGYAADGSSIPSLAELIAEETGNAILNLFARKDATAAGTITLDNFRFLPLSNPVNSSFALTGRPGTVRIEGDNRVFTDLAEAMAAATDGSILLLDGDLECRGEIIANHGHSLSLRAASSRSKPSIYTLHPTRSALSTNGPTTLSGIRFFRPTPRDGALPIITINARGGDCVVEDCEFIAFRPGFEIPGHRGLGLSDCRSATIRHCGFHIPGGHAIVASSGMREVDIEDCFFFSHAAIESNSAEPESQRRLALSRCVLFSGCAITNKPGAVLPPMHVDVADSICHLLRSGFYLADIPASDLASLIKWSSRDNVYRAAGAFVRTYRSRMPGSFAPVTIGTDSQRERYFSDPDRFTEQDSILWPEPFRLGDLPLDQVTAKRLLETLDPTIESKAITTLERFAEALPAQDL